AQHRGLKREPQPGGGRRPKLNRGEHQGRPDAAAEGSRAQRLGQGAGIEAEIAGRQPGQEPSVGGEQGDEGAEGDAGGAPAAHQDQAQPQVQGGAEEADAQALTGVALGVNQGGKEAGEGVDGERGAGGPGQQHALEMDGAHPERDQAGGENGDRGHGGDAGAEDGGGELDHALGEGVFGASPQLAQGGPTDGADVGDVAAGEQRQALGQGEAGDSGGAQAEADDGVVGEEIDLVAEQGESQRPIDAPGFAGRNRSGRSLGPIRQPGLGPAPPEQRAQREARGGGD